jgi:(S)-ureidoglycine aminohydrolase
LITNIYGLYSLLFTHRFDRLIIKSTRTVPSFDCGWILCGQRPYIEQHKLRFFMSPKYYAPKGGHPGQDQLLTDRAVFTDAYAVIPKGTMRDIVTSFLPFWEDTRLWVIARPLSGFSETFSQYIMEVSPGGGSDRPELDEGAEGVLFVVEGSASLTVDGKMHTLTEGGYAFLPPATDWTLYNTTDEMLRFHWIRKAYEPVEGLPYPEVIITNEQDVAPNVMPDTEGRWATTRFVEPTDLRHDMHVNIVTFEPGGVIPFLETHVMEHGLYVLEGKAAYRLNSDWVEVEAGDYMWLRAFCPQACYAGGPGRFRYLLYKDVNRHMKLR